MTRNIYLEGELALKFGAQHSFHGDSVRDALRLLDANRPGFKKYFIDAADCDIGFHIEVGGQELDNPLECLLPLREGDIIITPIAAGSKSGGGKILTAIAIVAFMIAVPGSMGALLNGTAFGATAGSTAAAIQSVAALTALSVATNLAITGIQQLMAPDPSVDQQDEGYLFNGSEQTIVEGMPIPLLYGELRVPGYPVSFEMIHGDKRVTSTDTIVTVNGENLSVTKGDIAGYIADKLDKGIAVEKIVDTKSGATASGSSQDILFTDIISEGPIYGLVDGGTSVFLNDDPAQITAQSFVRLSETPVEFDFTLNSTSVTIDRNGVTKNIEADTENGTKFIIVRNYGSSSASVVRSSVTGSANSVTITSSTGIFVPAMEYDRTNFAQVAIIRLLDSNSSTVFEGYVESYSSSTVAKCIPLPGTDLNPALSNGSYTVVVDGKFQVASISSTTLTLASNFPGNTGSYKCDLSGTNYETVSLIDSVSRGSKQNSYDVQFRNGNLIQPAFSDAAGTGVGSISIGPGGSFSAFSPVLYNDPVNGTNNPTVEYTGTSASGFGLTAAQAEEVDEVRVTFAYGQLWNRNEKGEQGEGTVKYDIYVAVERNGSFDNYQLINNVTPHVAVSNAPRIFEEIIDMRQYQPFTDFKVKITRTTNNDQAYNKGTDTVNTNYTTSSDGLISALNSIIKENLSYPLTAMAKVRINSKDFQNVPTRTYHCKGVKVKVPSNYVTRDEGVNSVATYNRNVSTGSVTSSYQDWDGNFRADKVYTNNPAWVFYDILTNNRYGLGEWLNENEIDKYALYRIARYCDELVPDGNGGFEPRFTTNVYFTQASDAYKIVKDLATVFRSMIYWMDGEVYTVIDQPGDPIYNFSKSNVIDGAFGYETTGSKTRANQIVVTWNNPAANYKLENLIVEDRDNIINTGRILSEEAVAFGATTEGQALRYGRWKLWTAVNQTEIVSFKTAINAAFIAPGDIINIQDSDRYPGNLKYSGRVSNTGTRNATTIPLDREIELNSASDYELSVLFTDSVATLAQDSATIDSVSYSRGDVIDGATIDTETEASNILDDSGDYVDVTWKPYTNIETQTVFTSSGTGITSLTVSSAFSTTPSAENVWVLKESISGVEVEGSKKMYKILSISEESKNIYGITGVEFYNEKYAAVDENFVLSTQDPVFSPPTSTEAIPAPRNAYVIVSNLNSGQVKDDVVLSWDNPVDSNGDFYNYVDYFEVSGNIPGFPTTMKVSRNQTSLSGLDLPIGTFTLAVRTIAQNGRRSDATRTTFTIEDPARQAVPRAFGMALGGVLSSPAFITSAGIFTLEDKAYSLSPVGNPQLVRTFDGSPATEYTQDCSTIASLDFSTFTNDQAEAASHYIMIDGDDTDPLKLIKYYKDEDLGYSYFYNAGTGNTTHTSNWTSIGTVSVAANSNRVTGSGFNSSLQVGDIIKFSSTQAAKVVYVASNTDVRIDKSFSTAISSVTGYRNSFRFNKNDDSVIYSVRNDNGTFRAYPINLAINPDLAKVFHSVILTVNPTFFNFDGDETLTTDYTNLVLTATAFGYKNPVFKFTGSGFNNSEISQTADTVFSVGTNFVATKTLDKVDEYSITDLIFSVTVAEELDETNLNKQSTADITIPFVKDGAAGAGGKLVRLTSDDYSVVYDDTGANPSPSGTLTFTATASNFTNPYFKFTGDGITDETSYTDGTGDSDTFTYSIPTSTAGWAGNPLTIRVGVAEASAPTNEVAFDTISIFYVADGVDGVDGIDGYTVITTNSAHTFTSDNSGTVSTYSGSGTSIEVYKGGTELNSVTGTPAAGQFSVSVSTSNITAGTTSVVGNPFTIGDHSNMTADTSVITYTLNIENLITGTQKQTFSKSKGADALTVSSSTVNGVTTLTFSDGTSATILDGTDGVTKGVAAIFASDASGSNQSYTQGSLTYVNYYEYTGTKPTLPVSGLTWVKYIGEDGDSEGVIPIYADDASGTNATFTYSSQEFINFYEWSGTSPGTVPSGLTYVRFIGRDADALTVSSSTVNGVTTLTFSDGTSATILDGTDGVTKGVAAIFASDASGSNQSYTQGSLTYVNYYEYTGTKPTLPVSGLTWVKYIGEDGDSEGVIPIYADDASGTNATFTYSSQEFINFYEWSGTAPTTVPSGLTYVRFIGRDADALTVSSSTVNGVTTLTFSDGTSATILDGTDGVTKGVAAIFASDASGSNQSYTQGSLTYVNYYEYTGTKPTLPVSGLTWVKYIGEDGDSEGVIPIYADDASGTNATFTYSSQEFINFYEWSGTAPTTVPSGLTYVKFVGDNGLPGADGQNVDIVFKRSATQPATPSPSAGTPTGWYSDVNSVPSSSAPLWASTGTKAGGVTNFTWQTPVQVEGSEGTPGLSVAELSIFRRASSTPSTPTGGSFTFPASLTPPSGWYVTPPAGTDPVYISRGFAESSSSTGTDSSITWSTPVLFVENGTDGLPGATGPTGPTGPDGDPGLRRAEGYLYYQSAGTPATTPSGIYTWSTGAVSGTNIGTGSTQWNTVPPQMAAGASAQYYVRRWKALETTANSTSTGLSIDPATLGHNFAGVVTFSSGTLTDGSSSFDPTTKLGSGQAAADINSNVTTIDGGKITANSITANLISSTFTQGATAEPFYFAVGASSLNFLRHY
jgi:predicted phage tail protein